MSEDQTTQSDAPEVSGPKELREALKRREAENEELKAQVAALTDAARAQAFAQAGVPEDKWGAAFRKTYDGPIDVAAIRSQVDEWGIPMGDSAPQQEQANRNPLVQSGDPIDVSNPDLEMLGQIQQVRGTDPVPGQNDAITNTLEKMRQTGDFTQADLIKFLAENNMIADGD